MRNAHAAHPHQRGSHNKKPFPAALRIVDPAIHAFGKRCRAADREREVPAR